MMCQARSNHGLLIPKEMKFLFVCVTFAAGQLLAADERPRPMVPKYVKSPRSVAAAVADFNRRMAEDEIGKTQKVITEEEVLNSLALVARMFVLQKEGGEIDSYIDALVKTKAMPAYADLGVFQGTTSSPNGKPIRCWTVFVEFELDRFHEPGMLPRPLALVRHAMLE